MKAIPVDSDARRDKPAKVFAEAADYEIVIQGCLALHWSDWLAGAHMHVDEDGNTHLSARFPDQAALHGLLARVRDLGLTLLLVRRS